MTGASMSLVRCLSVLARKSAAKAHPSARPRLGCVIRSLAAGTSLGRSAGCCVRRQLWILYFSRAWLGISGLGFAFSSYLSRLSRAQVCQYTWG